jgi:hypothetical protein
MHSGAAGTGATAGGREDELSAEGGKVCRRLWLVRARCQAHDVAAAGQTGGVRVLGREDRVEAIALASKTLDREIKVRTDAPALAQAFLLGFFAAGFLAAGLASALGLVAGASFTGLAALGLAAGFSTEP